MEFMNGVTLVKEAMDISSAGIYIIFGTILGLFAASVGGVKLYLDGLRGFSGVKRVSGVVVSIASIALMTIVGLLYDTGSIVSLFDKIGLAECSGYEVTVASDVDMNEFQSCYDIVKYEDGIYTVKTA